MIGDARVIVPQLHPAFRRQMDAQIKSASYAGDVDLANFLRTTYAQMEAMIDGMGKLCQYLYYTDEALKSSVTTNQHLMNDWTMIVGGDGDVSTMDDLKFTPEVIEGMEAVSFFLEKRFDMDATEEDRRKKSRK